MESQHLTVWIDRPAAAVYDYAADPAHLPAWAVGLGSGIELVDGEWVCDSPMGKVTVAFVPRNPFGVLDHDVRLPSGETVRNPMRVIGAGDRCEVVFTLRQAPGVSDQAFADDRAAVQADLARLQQILEANAGDV